MSQMPETTQAEQLEQPLEIPQEVLEKQDAPPQASLENFPEEPQKKPKQSNILIPLLTVLLVLLGIGEAVFWGYFAVSAYSNSLARERYEQQQKALAEEQASKGIRGGSSYSPNLKVENGTVTWEREKRSYAGSSQPANTTSSTPQRADGLRLSRLPVIRVPYLLAKMDTEETVPSPQPEVAEGAPVST